MEVVETGSLAVQRVWAPVDATDRYRIGMLVGWESGAYDGVVNAAGAGAAPDATTNICGIIEAVDTLEPLYDSSNQGHYVDGVETQAAQIARKLGPISDKGPWVFGDPTAHVKVALLTPFTKVKVPLYNAAVGARPRVLTVTSIQSSDGLDFSSNAVEFSPIADEAVAYCLTGANAGIMRQGGDTSATKWEGSGQAFPYDIAVGDTFLRIPCRAFGASFLSTDGEALYFDTSLSNTNDWRFKVLELNLSVSGQEHVIGYFNAVHFD